LVFESIAKWACKFRKCVFMIVYVWHLFHFEEQKKHKTCVEWFIIVHLHPKIWKLPKVTSQLQ
jgi:hypothetical protein